VHLRPSAESFAVARDGQGLEQRVVRLLTAGPALVRAGVDIDQALADVRERVDLAKSDLPDDTDEPIVNEVNLALFPVLVVTLSGDLPERALLALARHLEDRIEALTNVLDVEIAGDREELLEVVIDPLLVQSYGRQLDELLAAVSRNNRLVAAGALDTGRGRFAVKVPGVFETPADVLNSRPRSSATRWSGSVTSRACGAPSRTRRALPGQRPSRPGARGLETDRRQHHRHRDRGARTGRSRAATLASRTSRSVGFLQDKSHGIKSIAAVRHRDERGRDDRARRHRGQQQHRPDRHLQRASEARSDAVRCRAADQRAAAAPGAIDHRGHDPWPAADGAQDQHRPAVARGDLR
jgi:AcrB/AcrD/AcrF family